jgi:hypothetical protein
VTKISHKNKTTTAYAGRNIEGKKCPEQKKSKKEL